MSERNAAAKRPGADTDAWVWQSQILDDLAAFVRAHGPASKAPLPVLNWTIGAGRSLGVDLPSFEPDAQRMATLDAYAAVLGTAVTSRVEKDRTVAHSPALTAAVIPAAVAIVVAEVACVATLIYRRRTAR